MFRGRTVGVYMASDTRLVLLEAGLLDPTPEVVPVPPPPAARSSESFGEEDGSESFLLFFNVFIFVMVFSITLVASVSRIRCAMLCCSEEFEVDDNLKFCIRFRRGGTYVNHFLNLFVVQYRYA